MGFSRQEYSQAYIQTKGIQRDTHTPVSPAALASTVKTQEQPECPTADEWTKKQQRHAQRDAARPRKRETVSQQQHGWTQRAARQVKSASQGRRRHGTASSWSLSCEANGLIYKTEADSEAQETISQSPEEGGVNQELGIHVCTLLLLRRFSRVRLCDPRDGSPPGSPVPGILQARTLEWVCTHQYLLNR